jgi:4-methyl-5(b-hydroxyethyl)-thiazole monophosphate biosynthesis
MTQQSKALVLLAEGCEEIEAVSIINILRRGGVAVTTASLQGIQVTGSRGIGLVADTTLERVNPKQYQMIALPGGAVGPVKLSEDSRVSEILMEFHREDKWIGAICAAPAIVLQPLGILQGRKATGYPALKDNIPGYQDAPVVMDGHIVTGQGPAMAQHFAVALVAALCGMKVAKQVTEDLLLK